MTWRPPACNSMASRLPGPSLNRRVPVAYPRPPPALVQVSIYVSFYVEAANRDAFMAIKQDLLLAFVDCVERNNARLARNRWQVRVPGGLGLVGGVGYGVGGAGLRAATSGWSGAAGRRAPGGC